MFQLKSSQNIYQTFKPFYWILKVFGCASYSFNENYQDLNVRLCDKIYTLMWILMYLVFLALSCYWGEQEEIEDSNLIKHGWHKLHLFETIYLVVVLYFNYKNFKVTKMILHAINEFDVMANMENNWHFKLNHTKQRSLVIYFTIGCIFMAFVKILLSIVQLEIFSNNRITSLFFYHLSIEMIALITWQLVFFSYQIKVRYEIYVKNFIRLNLKEYQQNYKIMRVIDKYYNYHTILNKALQDINSIYTVQVII